MKIVCITVGKKHDKKFSDAIDEYVKRMRSYTQFEWLLIPSSNIESESANILSKLLPDDKVVLLDENGKMYSNLQIANKLEVFQNQSVKRLVVIIGGAYGVNVDVKNRADHIVALSTLVFPHQLVRLIVIEQLYRCCSLLSGGKYHHH